jgi:response regulator RpfG family c-di-GMP phosphodiesterase
MQTGSILVVDDDTKVLEILQKSLSRHGYKVHVATDGEQALDMYRSTDPDMLVLDVILPDMDGREVYRILNNVDTTPTLFMSASADPEVMDSIFEVGAEDFLMKPFSLREFNLKVNKILGAYQNTRELEETKLALESEVSEQQESVEIANRELKRQLLSMKTLFTVSQDLNRRLDLEEMVNRFALTLVGEIQVANMAVFALPTINAAEYRLVGLKGFDRRRIGNLAIDRESDLIKWLEECDNGPEKISRRRGDQWLGRLPDVRLAVFEYVTPIVNRQRMNALVFTGPKLTGESYSKGDLRMLTAICSSAGVGMENARLFAELENTYLSTVRALVSIIEAKDAYTKGHTERVADYSVALGTKLNMPREDVRDLAFGAVLHDIGKLLVYERILNKPGDLDAKEWEILKKHPEIGAGIIENMDFLSRTVPLVRHHHERWDGRGYPDGLAGEDIPLGARIIAVADTFDAMTTDRSYRKALHHETALSHMRGKSGEQFDPDVVDAFVELIEKDQFRPRRRRQYEVEES